MLKSASVLFTILSLLACPLTCMGDAAATQQDEAAGTCSCCCPQHQESESGSEGPRRDQPSMPCANCVCHGAVVTKDDVQPETEAPVWMPDHEPDRPATIAVAVPQLAGWIGAFPPGPRSGRLIRYQMQSLLL